MNINVQIRDVPKRLTKEVHNKLVYFCSIIKNLLDGQTLAKREDLISLAGRSWPVKIGMLCALIFW